MIVQVLRVEEKIASARRPNLPIATVDHVVSRFRVVLFFQNSYFKLLITR